KVGYKFLGYSLIKECRRFMDKNSDPYLVIKFEDISGDIGLKVWKASNEDARILSEGNIVKVTGPVTEYRGIKQLTAEKFRLSNESDNLDLSTIVKTAPIDNGMMIDFIMHRVDEIENTTIHTIIKEFLSSNEDDLYKFMTYPA